MLVTVIIPTYDSVNYLLPCLRSIQDSNPGFCDIIVVNNGKAPLESISKDTNVKTLNPGKNLGWEGGLKLGLEHTKSEFICFMNDDTFVPTSSHQWLSQLIYPFVDPTVGAVGPVTNCSCGLQSIFNPNSPKNLKDATFLVGFCMMVRRNALDNVGGIDDTLPGGDDFDLSLRMRMNGYRLVIQPKVFVYHHGFVTGTKVNGDASQPGGWNSEEMTERTNFALIKKHGFKNFFSLFQQIEEHFESVEDAEGNIVREHVKGKVVLDLGCGASKTVENSIGVDVMPKGTRISTVGNIYSVADVVADVSATLPFEDDYADTIIARHILEHCIDPIKAVTEWMRVLKPEGRLIIAVPDQEIANTIPMNPEHVHAFTKDSLKRLLASLGLKVLATDNPHNFVSFVVISEMPMMREEILCK